MKIPLVYLHKGNERKTPDKFLIKLFKYLESDEEFISLIEDTKQYMIKRQRYFGAEKFISKVGKNINNLENDIVSIDLDKGFKLRSVGTQKSQDRDDFNNHIRVNFYPELDGYIYKIITAYPCLTDLKSGLKKYLYDDRFTIDFSNQKINLKIVNSKFLLASPLRDNMTDDAVKIVIRSHVSHKELVDWIDDNFVKIKKYLSQIDITAKTSRRENFERDRLISYLKDNKQMSFNRIANSVEANPVLDKDSVKVAYNRFPYHP